MPHHRKPGFNYDTTKPVAQANDIRRLRDAHQTTMNYNTGYMGLASIDGQAYPTINQKGLKDVFESCFVPFDDGNKVLVGNDNKTISQRGYGNVVKRKPVKVPQGNRPGITNQEVVRRYNTNVSVFTDFPKGAGRTDTQIAWRDGTYDEAVLSATKQIRSLMPTEMLSKISDYEYGEAALSAMTGAKAYGGIQSGLEMMKMIAEQEAIGKSPAEARLIRDLALQGVPLVNIRAITGFLQTLNRQRYADTLARDLEITNPRLVEQLAAIMPESIGLTANAQREAIRRFIEANRAEARVSQAEVDRDRPFMAGANTGRPMTRDEMIDALRRREAEEVFGRPPAGTGRGGSSLFDVSFR